MYHQSSQYLWICHWNRCFFLLIFCLFSLSASRVCTRPGIIWHICTIFGDTHTRFVMFSQMLDVFLDCESNFRPVCCWHSISYIFYCNPNSNIKHLQQYWDAIWYYKEFTFDNLTIYLSWTEQMPSCSMFELSDVFRTKKLICCI